MNLQRALSARRDRREAQFRMESLHIVGSILGSRFRLTSDLDLVIKGDRISYLSAKFDRTADRFGEEVEAFLRTLEEEQ